MNGLYKYRLRCRISKQVHVFFAPKTQLQKGSSNSQFTKMRNNVITHFSYEIQVYEFHFRDKSPQYGRKGQDLKNTVSIIKPLFLNRLSSFALLRMSNGNAKKGWKSVWKGINTGTQRIRMNVSQNFCSGSFSRMRLAMVYGMSFVTL